MEDSGSGPSADAVSSAVRVSDYSCGVARGAAVQVTASLLRTFDVHHPPHIGVWTGVSFTHD